MSNSVYEVACQAEDSGVAVCHEKEMESNGKIAFNDEFPLLAFTYKICMVGFVKLTKTAEISDDSQAPMYAIDCEMVYNHNTSTFDVVQLSIVRDKRRNGIDASFHSERVP